MKQLKNTTPAPLTHTQTSRVLAVGYNAVLESEVGPLADSQMFGWFADGSVVFNNGSVDFADAADGWSYFVTTDLPLLDTPDTVVAQLTREGRSLLARAKLGDVCYRVLGWQFGRGGYDVRNPVKIVPIQDDATEAEGSFEILTNAFDPADTLFVGGVPFQYGVVWLEGPTIAATVQNIRNAILSSRDTRHFRVVEPIIDPVNPNRLLIRHLVTGEIGNAYPIWTNNPARFTTTPLVGGTSVSLQYAAYPAPPNLAGLVMPDGGLERPATTAVSCGMRIPESTVGMNAYGEAALWVEVTRSTCWGEVQNVLSVPATELDLTGDQFLLAGHGLLQDAPIRITTDGTMPAGVTAGATYFVASPSFYGFQIATTPGGSPLDLTAPGTGSLTIDSAVGGAVGRKVLYALAHFPVQVKTDRHIANFRLVVNF